MSICWRTLWHIKPRKWVCGMLVFYASQISANHIFRWVTILIPNVSFQRIWTVIYLVIFVFDIIWLLFSCCSIGYFCWYCCNWLLFSIFSCSLFRYSSFLKYTIPQPPFLVTISCLANINSFISSRSLLCCCYLFSLVSFHLVCVLPFLSTFLCHRSFIYLVL